MFIIMRQLALMKYTLTKTRVPSPSLPVYGVLQTLNCAVVTGTRSACVGTHRNKGARPPQSAYFWMHNLGGFSKPCCSLIMCHCL